jgi:hypothetical protein
MRQNHAASMSAFSVKACVVKVFRRQGAAAVREQRGSALARTLAMCVVAVSMPTSHAWAYAPENVLLNFGVPGASGELNHQIVPNQTTISQDGIVNFAVVSGATGAADGGGFHQIAVYKVSKNTTVDDILGQIQPGTSYQVFDKAGTHVLSVTAGAPRVDSDPSGLRVFIEAAASSTPRLVGVFFDEPGTYLVICNVTGHFDDGMIAIVTVKKHWRFHERQGH